MRTRVLEGGEDFLIAKKIKPALCSMRLLLTQRAAILTSGNEPDGAHRENQRTETSGGYHFRVVPWWNKLSGFPQRFFS
jgi:hypothetical protein